MKFIKLCIGVLFICPTIALAGQNSSNFSVTFNVLPSCHIKTQNTNNNDIKIVSRCSHQDFYITESSSDNDSYNNSTLLQDKMTINQKTIHNETHTTISNIKGDSTLLTVNF